MPSFDHLNQIYGRCLSRLMKAIVRYSIQHSLSFQTFLEFAKAQFVETAAEELRKSGERPNVSRISVISGLHRKDVNRLFKTAEPTSSEPMGLLGRIIGQWESDPEFKTKRGPARVLSIEGGDTSEFSLLVRKVSQHINPGTVLFELERAKMIEHTPQGVRLKQNVEFFSKDYEKAFGLVASDCAYLMRSIEENVMKDEEVKNLYLHTEYDNVIEEELPKIRKWIMDEGQEFHRKAREFISQFDCDSNPEIKSKRRAGKRVVVTAFSATSPLKKQS